MLSDFELITRRFPDRNDITIYPISGVHLGAAEHMTRNERTLKRMIIALAITVVLLFATNAAWLYVWNQYDYESEVVTVDSEDGGNANYIGNNGDINNGVMRKLQT